MNWIRATGCAAAIAAWLLAAAVRVDAAEDAGAGPVIVGIEVKGLQAISESEFLGNVNIRKGQRLSPDAVSAAIDRLAERGFDVDVQERRVPEGVVLVFVVRGEFPEAEVAKVKVKGGSAGELADVIDTRKGSKLKRGLLQADAKRIREFYIGKGFSDAIVTYRTEPVEPGRVKVIFEVSEGPKFQLRKLTFIGNETFTHKQLAKVMQTRVDTFWTSRRFAKEAFDTDITRLNVFYTSHGFLDARVKEENVTMDYETGRVEAVILVKEGPRYRVAKVAFRGNVDVTNEQLAEFIRLQPGMYYSAETTQEDLDAIHRFYTTGSRGYEAQTGRTDVKFGAQPETVDVTYEIQEGVPTYIRRIVPQGNNKTRDKVIIREMRIEQGDLYDSDKVDQSVRRLRDLQYFETIDVRTRPAPPPEEGAVPGARYVDLVVEVKEMTTGRLLVGAGINTSAGLVGRIALEQDNFDISDLPDFNQYGIWALSPGLSFMGGGQRFSLVAEPGSRVSRYYMDFRDPWFLDYPVDFTLSAYLADRFFDGYAFRRAGGTVGFGKRFSREFTAGIRYRREEVKVHGLDAGSPIEAVRQAGTHDVGAYRFYADLDTRDSRIFPTRGGLFSSYAELGGPPAGGNVGFWKYGLEGGIYQKLWELPSGTPNILHVRAETGLAGPAFNEPELPIFERFFAGGIGSIRGFEFQGIGPRQTVPPGDASVGGQFLFLGSAEYIIPLYKEDYQMYIFSDVGTLTSDIRLDAFDQLRVSTGLGFRLNLPVMGRLPLSLNFAVPLKKEPRDKTEFFSFSLGVLF